MSRYKVRGKRRKKKGIVDRYAALPQSPRPKNSGKRALALLAVSAVLLAVYIAGWAVQDSEYYRFTQGVIMVYYLALPLLIVAFALLNKGISSDVPAREQLSEEMTEEQKDAFIEDIRLCRRRSRPLLIFIIPLAVIVGFDLLFNFIFA